MRKTFLFYITAKKVELAPAYDLLSTQVYPALASEFAMKIGGDAEFNKISRDSFARLAQECGIRPQVVWNRLDDLADKLPSFGRQLAGELKSIHPSPVYEAILKVIAKNVGNILKESK